VTFADENLTALGHISVKANGEHVAPLPGDVCVEKMQLPEIHQGSRVEIVAGRTGRNRGDIMSYTKRLLQREKDTGRPVRVGLAGAGQMGTGYVARSSGSRAWKSARSPTLTRTGRNRPTSRRVIEADESRHVVVTDAYALADADVDVVVDATGVPEGRRRSVVGCATCRETRCAAECRM